MNRSSRPQRDRSEEFPRSDLSNPNFATPLARQIFGEGITKDELRQYRDLLEEYDNDEEALSDAIQTFMEEYESDPEAADREFEPQRARPIGPGAISETDPNGPPPSRFFGIKKVSSSDDSEPVRPRSKLSSNEQVGSRSRSRLPSSNERGAGSRSRSSSSGEPSRSRSRDSNELSRSKSRDLNEQTRSRSNSRDLERGRSISSDSERVGSRARSRRSSFSSEWEGS